MNLKPARSLRIRKEMIRQIQRRPIMKHTGAENDFLLKDDDFDLQKHTNLITHKLTIFTSNLTELNGYFPVY